MELLRIDKLNYERAGKSLFAGLSMSIEQAEKLALIGANASGKSTLLELIATKSTTNSGAIKYSPGLKIAYLAQNESLNPNLTIWQYAKLALVDIENLERKLRELEKDLNDANFALYAKLSNKFEDLEGYQAEANLKRNLQVFGFGAADYSKEISKLSGGEQARLKLARVLSSPAELYLLDEPSNHLDIEMRQLLKKELSKLQTVLIASHDRDLINAFAKNVLELNAAKITKYKGNYSQYYAQKKHKELSSANKNKEIRKRFVKLKKQKRKLDEINTAKVQASKRRIERDLDRLEPVRDKKNSHEIAIKSEAKNKLLELRKFSKSYQKPVLANIAFSLFAGDKIAIVGKNASGKSTLFKLVAGLIESDNPKREIYWAKGAKLLYIDQKMRGLSANLSIYEQIVQYVSKERAEMLLSLVKIPFALWKQRANKLSGGQKMRVAIALIIAAEASILILDEPTNDLDIEMIEILEHSLAKTKTAVLFASHDASFVANVATQVWSLEEAKLLKYQAGLKGYFAKRLQIEDAVLLPKQVSNIEEDIQEKYELELMELDGKLSDPLRFSERELYRFKERSNHLKDELSVIYDAAQSEPKPSYQLRHFGIELCANKLSSGIDLQTNVEVSIRLVVKDKLGHLILKETDDSCLLPWARNILIDLIIDMSFMYLDLKLLQYFCQGDVSATKFAKRQSGWWIISRQRYEESEAYIK